MFALTTQPSEFVSMTWANYPQFVFDHVGLLANNDVYSVFLHLISALRSIATPLCTTRPLSPCLSTSYQPGPSQLVESLRDAMLHGRRERLFPSKYQMLTFYLYARQYRQGKLFRSDKVGGDVIVALLQEEVDGDSITSWRLLFIIPSPNVTKLVGFTQDDDPIVEVDTGRQMLHPLQVYDRTSQEFHNVGIEADGAKYIYPNATLAEMMNHVITDYTSDSEEERREVTQNDYTFDQMVERAEQEHFEDEELNKFNVIKKYGRIVYHPFIEYGGYALGCMTGADMKKATYMKMVRDELLRSMEEKR
ncbi:hypothetical protein Tco_0718191 [Tanacetum coccineum]